jgi:hypothetical protein
MECTSCRLPDTVTGDTDPSLRAGVTNHDRGFHDACDREVCLRPDLQA